MPDDSDKLNNEAMYGASSRCSLKEPRRLLKTCIIEYFVSRISHQRSDNVGGNWHKNRQPVGCRNVSQHRRRRTIGRRSAIRYLSIEVVDKGLSRKPRISDRSTISTSAQSIVDDTPQGRLVTYTVHP